jgi:hypothetical protein
MSNIGLGQHQHWRHEGMLGAISVGLFLLLVGFLFISIPDLFNDLVRFATGFTSEKIGSSNIYLPIPKDLSSYENIYAAAREFSVIWGVFLVAMIGARLILGSSTRRLAQNVGDIVFWLGSAYLIQVYLVASTQALTINTNTWLAFWALVIALIGISLIIRASFIAATKLLRPTKID